VIFSEPLKDPGPRLRTSGYISGQRSRGQELKSSQGPQGDINEQGRQDIMKVLASISFLKYETLQGYLVLSHV
jgi:hypothetical protein